MSTAVTNFTMSCWCYPTSISAEQVVIGNGSDTDGSGFSLEIDNSWQILIFGVQRFDTGVDVFPYLNTWVHIALVNTAGSSQFWLNGVAIGGTDSTGSGGTPQVWTIGGDQYPSHGSFIRNLQGNVADAAFWNVPLLQFELQGLASGRRPGRFRRPSLKFWMPLDGLASPEPDLSGNANNGTLSGTTKVFGPPFGPFTWTKGTYLPSGTSPPPPPTTETNINFIATGYRPTILLPSQQFVSQLGTALPPPPATAETNIDFTVQGYKPTSLNKPTSPFAPQDITTYPETNVNLTVRGYKPTIILPSLSFAPQDVTTYPETNTNLIVRGYKSTTIYSVPPFAPEDQTAPPSEANTSLTVRGYTSTLIRPILSFAPQDVSSTPQSETNTNFTAIGYKSITLLPFHSFAPEDQTAPPNEANTSQIVKGYKPTDLQPAQSFAPQDASSIPQPETDVNLVVRGYHPTSLTRPIPFFAPKDQTTVQETDVNFVARGYRPTKFQFVFPSYSPYAPSVIITAQVWQYLDMEMNAGFYSLDMGL
jgi:hypothetical protein